jgi:hypothetical protein
MSSQTTGTSAKDDLFTMIRESLPGSTGVQTRQWRERLQKLCVEPDGSRSTLFQTLEKVVTAAASRLDPALGGRRIDYQVTALIGAAYAPDKSGFSWGMSFRSAGVRRLCTVRRSGVLTRSHEQTLDHWIAPRSGYCPSPTSCPGSTTSPIRPTAVSQATCGCIGDPNLKSHGNFSFKPPRRSS